MLHYKHVCKSYKNAFYSFLSLSVIFLYNLFQCRSSPIVEVLVSRGWVVGILPQ